MSWQKRQDVRIAGGEEIDRTGDVQRLLSPREAEEAQGGGEVGKGGFTVSVDFSPMAFLLEELKKKAGAELRDVGPQILWELNKSMGAEAC